MIGKAISRNTKGLLLVGVCLTLQFCADDDSNPSTTADAGFQEDADVDAGIAPMCMVQLGSCPNLVLRRATGTCSINTSQATNWVEDTRLEFGAAGDAVLLFQAPETGEYTVEITESPSASSLCGASLINASAERHSPDLCSQSPPFEVDGIFVSDGQRLQFEALEEVLIIVSCSEFSMVTDGPFVVAVSLVL